MDIIMSVLQNHTDMDFEELSQIGDFAKDRCIEILGATGKEDAVNQLSLVVECIDDEISGTILTSLNDMANDLAKAAQIDETRAALLATIFIKQSLLAIEHTLSKRLGLSNAEHKQGS